MQVAAHLVVLRLADDRAYVGALVLRVADHHCIEDGGDSVNDLGIARAVHVQPRGGAAGLALPGEVHAADGALDRRVEVGVGEKTISGFLPPSSSVTVLIAESRGGSLDREADLGAAREGDPADLRMADEPVPRFGTEPGHNVEHAGWQQVLGEFAEP